MAKEVAIGKRATISKAQQNMILAVAATGLIVGISLAVVLHFIQRISFNATVIMGEDKAIVAYSNTIKNVGICKKPKGEVYSLEELKKCSPDLVKADDVPGTLRANIINVLAYDDALAAVSDNNKSRCIDETGKPYTLKFLSDNYDSVKDSEDEEKISAAVGLIKQCSALRLIPDALPSRGNDEALLSSLNKIFQLSGWPPESLSPTGTSSENEMDGLNSIMVNLSMQTDAEIVYRVLDNVEHSIREFNIERATIESGYDSEGKPTLDLRAQAAAYWIDPVELKETTKTITADKDTKKGKK